MGDRPGAGAGGAGDVDGDGGADDSGAAGGRQLRLGVGADRGSGSIMALGVVAATLTATVGSLAVVSAVLAAHTARSAADLAALAAAVDHQQGGASPCAEAARIAAASGARVSSCAMSGSGVVEVRTTSPVGLRLPGIGPPAAEGQARAGPDPDDP